ncbi:hypothetical protein D3C72_2360480 [compost metagenome]
MIDESLNRRRWSFTETAFDQKFPVLAREVWVLFRAREGKFLANDFLSQNEPRIVVARCQNMLKRAECIEAGQIGRGQAVALRIKPHR